MYIIGFNVYIYVIQKAAFSWIRGQDLWKTVLCEWNHLAIKWNFMMIHKVNLMQIEILFHLNLKLAVWICLFLMVINILIGYLF